jgi:hypothetical protein
MTISDQRVPVEIVIPRLQQGRHQELVKIWQAAINFP